MLHILEHNDDPPVPCCKNVTRKLGIRMHQWRRQESEVGGRQSPGVWGQKSPAGSRGRAEKHDINFALRITFMHAYCLFCFSYIITFVTGFSRISRKSDFQSLPYSSPTVYYVFTLLIGFVLRESQDRIQGRLAAAAPFAPPSWRR